MNRNSLFVAVALIILVSVWAGPQVATREQLAAAQQQRAATVQAKPLGDGKYRLVIPVHYCGEVSQNEMKAWLTTVLPDREQVGGLGFVTCSRTVDITTATKKK